MTDRHTAYSAAACGDLRSTTEYFGDRADETCTGLVGCDASDGSMSALVAALGDPDVVAAVAAGYKLYGTDPRPVDGALLRIVWRGTTFEIGDFRAEPPNVPVPAGLERLYKTLQAIAPPLTCAPRAPDAG